MQVEILIFRAPAELLFFKSCGDAVSRKQTFKLNINYRINILCLKADTSVVQCGL